MMMNRLNPFLLVSLPPTSFLKQTLTQTNTPLSFYSLVGMSFSKRQSKWANSALVVSVTPEDMKVRERERERERNR